MSKRSATPIPVANFNVTDKFFAPRMGIIREYMLPYQWDVLNDRQPDAAPSHSIENFRIAAGLCEGKHQGMVFQDSDLYKWLEAVAFAIEAKPDAALLSCAEEIIDILEKAQQPDGYLNTYYQLNAPDKKWTNLQDNHELYCAGHLIEAAVAYTIATGTEKFKNIAIRLADLIDSVFGPEDGKMKGYPGHEVIEMALVKLYRLTGENRYLNLAKYFIDQRGQQPLYFPEEGKRENRPFYWEKTYMKYQYYQAGKPVREQTVAEGHAVRAVYLYSGMADVAMETDDDELWKVCELLFDNIANKQMYITGAIGASEVGESFTYDYDLPNDTVYAETCAQLGLSFFAQRMLQKNVDSRYSDVIERVFYNGALSGMSLDGTRFFYVNPLEVVPKACVEDDLRRHVKPERQKWFPCACCPPNLARALTSIGTYAYSVSDDTLYVHMYVGGDIDTVLNGQNVKFSVESDYPWDGTVSITAHTEGKYTLALRVPGWCGKCSFAINGEKIEPIVKAGYAYMEREWKCGDRLTTVFDMPVTLIRANPAVREDVGKLAVMRGPLVYCLEEADNGGDLHKVFLSADAKFRITDRPELLSHVVTLECDGFELSDKGFEDGALYAPANRAISYEPKTLTWIPYYAFTNRGIGEMTVWVREKN